MTIAIVLFTVNPVVAINPLDDDAHSGGDAGDRRELALRIAPGSYNGRLTSIIDEVDGYVFAARAGDWLHLKLDSDRFVFANLYGPNETNPLYGLDFALVASGENLTTFLPYSGSWFLAVQTTEIEQPALARYAFSLGLSTPHFGFFEGPSATAATYEFNWENPGRILVEARLPLHLPAQDPASMLVVIQANLRPVGAFVVGLLVGETGTGRMVTASLGGHHVEALELSGVSFGILEAGGRLIFDSGSSPQTGSVRVVLLHSSNTSPSVSISSDGLVHHAKGYGRMLEWSEATGSSEIGIVFPGVSVAGPRSISVNVDGLALGFFMTGSFDGSIVEPSGQTHWLGPGGYAALLGLENGAWRFGVEATAGFATRAERHYLIVAQVPLLGLVPESRSGLRIHHSQGLCLPAVPCIG